MACCKLFTLSCEEVKLELITFTLEMCNAVSRNCSNLGEIQETSILRSEEWFEMPDWKYFKEGNLSKMVEAQGFWKTTQLP